MSYVAVGIAGAGALAKGITGIIQSRKARRIEKSNPFVTENANPLFQKNVAIAENMARVGMPQQQYNNAINNIGRNQAGAIRQLGRSANPGAGLASMVRASNDATIGVDIKDANDRVNNQRFASGQRLNLAQEQNRVWDWNKRQKFLQLLSKSEALKGAGMQNMMGAFNDVSRIGMTALMGGGIGGAESVSINQNPSQVNSQLMSWMGANANSGLPGNNLSKLMSQPKFTI